MDFRTVLWRRWPAHKTEQQPWSGLRLFSQQHLLRKEGIRWDFVSKPWREERTGFRDLRGVCRILWIRRFRSTALQRWQAILTGCRETQVLRGISFGGSCRLTGFRILAEPPIFSVSAFCQAGKVLTSYSAGIGLAFASSENSEVRRSHSATSCLSLSGCAPARFFSSDRSVERS